MHLIPWLYTQFKNGWIVAAMFESVVRARRDKWHKETPDSGEWGSYTIFPAISPAFPYRPASLAIVIRPPPTLPTPKTAVPAPFQQAQQPPLQVQRPKPRPVFNPPTLTPAASTSTRVRPSVAKTGRRELANEKENGETGDKVHGEAGGGRAGGKKRQIQQEEDSDEELGSPAPKLATAVKGEPSFIGMRLDTQSDDLPRR